jgi:putative hemolysin
MYKISQAILSLLLAAAFIGACSAFQNATQPTPAPTPATNSSIANPASTNCIKQGGKSVIQTRGDGSQYGICVFEENKQCEEWALFRGECPVGGLKITGYVTLAAQYCVITGGQYTITANSNQANEQGSCTFKNGKKCDAADFYNGKCDANN